MAATVARMTKHELKEIIESTVEQKLLELLGDPDQGLVPRKTLKDRLLRQRKAVASGERGESLTTIVKRLRLNERVHWLAENLEDTTLEVLTGELDGLFKLRIGDYRVVYELIHDEQLIMIHAIGHRREVYRRR